MNHTHLKAEQLDSTTFLNSDIQLTKIKLEKLKCSAVELILFFSLKVA